MGERSSSYFSSPRSRSINGSGIISSGNGRSKKKTILEHVYTKRLTYYDLLTGMLYLPNASVIFFPKKHEGKHDRIMVPFKDYKGETWDLEILREGLSWNWDRFVKAHGLNYQDEISFYDEDINAKHFLIFYRRSLGEKVRVQMMDQFS